jgi:diguanylate cyclase (GGDEF)-like protein
MTGLLYPEPLDAVFNAWRRTMRLDPLLSRLPMPELRPFAEAFNLALTGDDEQGALGQRCSELVRSKLEPNIVISMTTKLAESFADEVGTHSGAVTKGFIETLGHVCGLLTSAMVANERNLARRDALTALENRLAWDEAIADDAQSAVALTVAVIDLDGFKLINDQGGGHDAGDQYLKEFARDLTVALPKHATAYRYAGDEFAIRWLGSGEAALSGMLKALQDNQDVAPFSFGVANGTVDPQEREALFKLADHRLYAMKDGRRTASAMQASLNPEGDEKTSDDEQQATKQEQPIERDLPIPSAEGAGAGSARPVADSHQAAERDDTTA